MKAYALTAIPKTIKTPHASTSLESAGEKTTGKKLWKSGAKGVEKNRHPTATSILGKLFCALPRELWDIQVWGAIKEWNAQNQKPLDEQELRRIYDSMRKKHEDGIEQEDKRSLAVRILELIEKEPVEFFHDEQEDAHAYLTIGGHHEVICLANRAMRRWLGDLMWKGLKTIPGKEIVSSVLTVLEAKAVYDGKRYPLTYRIAYRGDGIWYDLGDRQWQAIQITPNGYSITSKTPILFTRYRHTQPQVLPVAGGDLREFLSLVNLADRSQGVLILVWIVAAFLPHIPRPIPNLHGPQGSAKTTLARMIRRLIDPSLVEVLSFPHDARELVQMLAHHYVAFFDNLSSLTEERSDMLCRAVTGEGTSKRMLYSDDDDVVYNFRRIIGFTGINPTATRPDLLDRSMLIRLERIPEDKRREESAVLAEFEAMRPPLIGAIFTALSKAMAIYPTVQLQRLPRMADFCRWGCAIAQALGYTQDEFLSAYLANIKEQHEEAIRGSQLASAVIALLEERGSPLEGRSSELYGMLREIAEKEKLNVKEEGWPRSPNWLLRRLNEIRTNLLEVGISIDDREQSRGTIITITKTPENTATTAMPPQGASGSDLEIVDTLEAACEVFGVSREQVIAVPKDGSTDAGEPTISNNNATEEMAPRSADGDSGSNGNSPHTSYDESKDPFFIAVADIQRERERERWTSAHVTEIPLLHYDLPQENHRQSREC